MLDVEAKDLVNEGNSPAQLDPFQKQLKSPKRGKNKPVIDPRPKVQTVNSHHVDGSESPETSEPQHSELEQVVIKSGENYIEKSLISNKGDSIVNSHSSIEHERIENKDQERLDGKPQNLKSRARLESEERVRLLHFDSLSEKNVEFQKEISNLRSLHEDVSRKDSEHQQNMLPQNPPQDKLSNSLAQRSAYDNCPLSAISNPLHINVLKEKVDCKVTESMPRILPPQDVQNSVLENGYKVMLPTSTKFHEEARQPLLEESSQKIVYGDYNSSRTNESNRTIPDNNETSRNSSCDCLCCW